MSSPTALSLRRIYAMVLRHLYLFRKSWVRVIESTTSRRRPVSG